MFADADPLRKPSKKDSEILSFILFKLTCILVSHHKVKESWFVITNLDHPNEVIKLYKKRAGIEREGRWGFPSLSNHAVEAMFRDYKSGGYNLEGSKANILRLTNLILLIAIAQHLSLFKRQIF